MPRGASLIVEQEDYNTVASDPVAAKYLRSFKMGKELIHNIPRWCLWMVDLDPADLQKSKVLRDRIEANREFRLQSSAESTRKMAETPHLFGQRAQPEIQYLAIPKVFSEKRRFATVALLEPEVIAGDKLFTAADPDGFAFAIASSSMFITWQKTVGGRLKSDVSFSNTVVWNNLPLPRIDPSLREKINDAGQGVITARGQSPEQTLAQHYNRLVMAPTLLKAHAKLDALVDKAFGAKSACGDEKQRQEILFARYAEMAEGAQL